MVSMAVQQAARVSGATYDVVRDVACLPLSLVNVFFYGEPGAGDRNWVLIDAGLAGSVSRIKKAAAERFGRHSRPAAIVLTHGHFDHVGALPDLADEWDVPIYCHWLEMPYLIGWSSYAPPDPAVGGGMMAFLSRFYPKGPYDFGRRMRTLPVDGSIPWMPGWQWVHTPGHTAGHVSLFRDSDRTLIVGDAFVTTKQESLLAVLSQTQQVHAPPAYFTPDWPAARNSVKTLARLRPEVAATGHGRPMYGDGLRQGLNDLLQNWEASVPHYGRYIASPAVADERGIEYVPPPVVDRYGLAIAGVGGAVLAGFILAWSQSAHSDRHVSKRRRR
jgi:glyoxylase-like metal-dependent hydrolase (beta-lactamase superfamily II)